MNRPAKSNIRASYVLCFAKKVVTALTTHELLAREPYKFLDGPTYSKVPLMSRVFEDDVLRMCVLSILKIYETNEFAIINKNIIHIYITCNMLQYIILLALLRFGVCVGLALLTVMYCEINNIMNIKAHGNPHEYLSLILEFAGNTILLLKRGEGII